MQRCSLPCEFNDCGRPCSSPKHHSVVETGHACCASHRVPRKTGKGGVSAFPEGEDGPRMAGGGGTPSQVGQPTPSDYRPELKRCCRACCPDKLWDKLVDGPDSAPCDRCGNMTGYRGEIAFVASLQLKACGPCKTWKDCARDNFCFRRENAERAARSVLLDSVPTDTVAAAEPGHPMNPLLKLSLDLTVQQYLQAHPGKTAETTTVHELLTWWSAL